MVLTDDEAIAKKINSAVFPGLQGGPLMHVIAAKAVAFGEALQPEFKTYAKATSIANAQALAARLKERGADLVAGGTDTHLRWSICGPRRLTGKRRRRERSSVPASPATRTAFRSIPLPPFAPAASASASPAGTTRGFGEAEFRDIGDMVADVLDGLRQERRRPATAQVEQAVDRRVRELCARFPIYQG